MEESAPLIASMTTWFTPTVLFIFLNLMIATILFTSNLPNNNNPTKPQQQQQQQQTNDKPSNQNDTVQSKLARSPSILHRLKSFNLYSYRSQDEQPSSLTNFHDQQALEIAATQYVFNHPFSDEQDLQPNPKRFDLDPTQFCFDPTHIQNNAASVNDPKRFDLDPTQIDLDPTRMENEALSVNESLTHEQDLQPVSANLKRSDFDPTQFDSDPTQIENETQDEENDVLESLDEVYSKITGGNVNRTKSDTLPASGEVPVKLPAKMKKSASLKSAFAHFEEDKIVEARRPATVRERRAAAEDDVEVDAKADDFINKFKHQLKLQRLDSIVRYKDMVNRGGGK